MVSVSADIENTLRALPSVDQLLQRPRIAERVNGSGHGLVVVEARLALDRMRAAIRKAPPRSADEAHLIDEAEQRVLEQLDALASPSLRPVINATGVVLHTNLGRAPLSDEAVAAITRTARGFSNLEYDLATGKRGKRDVHTGGLLEKLLGAPAIVVNNNAAAIFLVLNEVAGGGGLGERVLGIVTDEGVEIFINGGDAVEAGLGGLAGGELPRCQLGGEFVDRERVRHGHSTILGTTNSPLDFFGALRMASS